jgi:archaeal type IV pilus assembly protein PilA
MRQKSKPRDEGVSPVVGVMLMLVVTIIIAAVVSAFAGGISSGQQKAPSMAARIDIVNGGGGNVTGVGSQFTVFVDSVSEPIPTSNIKILTSWMINRGTITKGGNITIPGVQNYKPAYLTPAGVQVLRGMPYGYGSGVNWSKGSEPGADQMFGNYSISSGTIMHTNSYGRTIATGGYGVQTKYTYQGGAQYVIGQHLDGMQQTLGGNWNLLRQGDVVNVKFIHIPSGKVLLDKDVIVKE